MDYVPFSPFMRPMTHAHLAGAPDTETPPAPKWELLRDLGRAQAAFGVTERDLAVLQGLLTFSPGDMLAAGPQTIVFASNRALCERLHGMAESTLRRHLAHLVAAGLIGRRDSPNGKRFARRTQGAVVAYGLDLAPLLVRAAEIRQAAQAARDAEDRLRRLRETASLMRRDLAAIAAFGLSQRPGLDLWERLAALCAESARLLRRKPVEDDLLALRAHLAAGLDHARTAIDAPGAEDMGATARQNERHHQNSDKETIDRENRDEDAAQAVAIPLQMVTRACPTLGTMHDGPLRHWHQLQAVAERIRPALGIGTGVWQAAQRILGREQAAAVVAVMLERFAEIRSPGAYLRALTAKAAAGAFSCGPMLMALMGRPGLTGVK